jgi:hypothetical protein
MLMRRMLAATIAAATLALGLALPASAQLPRSDTARATDAGEAAAPRSACPITVGGKRGEFWCGITPTNTTFDGRHHVFLVGSNRQIYYIWQLRPGGSAYSNWTTLGGQGYSRVHVTPFSTGINLSVLGFNGSIYRNYCKEYRVGYGWYPWRGC